MRLVSLKSSRILTSFPSQKWETKAPHCVSVSHLENPNASVNLDSNPLLSSHSLKLRNNGSKPQKHIISSNGSTNLGRQWMEIQGCNDWSGLLDPLDDNLRSEILRYGQFIEAAYRSFNFDPSSPSYASCKFPKTSIISKSEVPVTGYKVTKNLRATSGVQLPRWMDRAPSWTTVQSSWIGYVAVCDDKDEIARLGRRDVVIAFRGTATCLEWLENLRATLTWLRDDMACQGFDSNSAAMVESGFLSLYTSRTNRCRSLQESMREEIAKVLDLYKDEPLSFTFTGHSLGAALATLAAHDITCTYKNAPMATVFSFGGPRVGNRQFRCQLESQGTKILRIVNSDDVITKVPGFIIENEHDVASYLPASFPSWLQKYIDDAQLAYTEVGKELRLSSRESPYLSNRDIATCHELKTYLHLVEGFVSSSCPFRASARRVLDKHI